MTPTIHPFTRRGLVSLLVVLVVAAVLRLDQLGITDYDYDSAAYSQLALNFATGKIIPRLGLAVSWGFATPPIHLYVLAVPFVFSGDPTVATGFIALLNAVGVGLSWVLAYRYFHPTVALFAGLAYAVSPWVLYHSRKIWSPDMYTPFLLLGILLAMIGFIENRRGSRWAQIASLPVLMLGVQIYYAGAAVLPVYIWLVWKGRKNIIWWVPVTSVAITFLTLLPFLYGVAEANAWYTFTTFLPATQERGVKLSSLPLQMLSWFITGFHTESVFAGGSSADLLRQVPQPVVLWQLLDVLAVLGLVGAWFVYRPWRIFLLVWIVVPVVVLIPVWTGVHVHYFVALFPALCLLIGIGAEFLHRRLAVYLPVIGKGVIPVGLAVIFLTQAVWWRGALGYTDQHPTDYFTIPLHYWTQAQAVLAPYKNVVIVSDNFYTRYWEEPVIVASMLRKSARCVRAINGEDFAILPTGPFATITLPLAPENPSNNLYHTGNSTIIPFRSATEGSLTIATFDNGLDWTGSTLQPIEPAHFDNGIDLIGYRVEKDRVFLEWRVPPDAQQPLFMGHYPSYYQFFVHFLDDQGERIDQHDETFLPPVWWCAGDRIIHWFSVNSTEKIAALRVGMYNFEGPFPGKPHNRNVLDKANNPIGQWVDIPVTKIAN